MSSPGQHGKLVLQAALNHGNPESHFSPRHFSSETKISTSPSRKSQASLSPTRRGSATRSISHGAGHSRDTLPSSVELPSSSPKGEKQEVQLTIFNAGLGVVNGVYSRKGRKNNKKAWFNSSGVSISYEIVGDQPGWIIGKVSM